MAKFEGMSHSTIFNMGHHGSQWPGKSSKAAVAKRGDHDANAWLSQSHQVTRPKDAKQCIH